MKRPQTLYALEDISGMIECRESAYKVTRITATENSSKQNSRLISRVALGPNALRPISEYERKRGSARMILPRIFALQVMVSDRVVY